jgi:phosphoadenosine phosphosulfate reductase
MENALKIEFNNLLENASTGVVSADFLQVLAEKFPEEVIFSTSFSYEDQVVNHLIKNLDIDIFTLDTGRLFEQTYETWTSSRAFFKKNIKAYYPDPESLQQFVSENGPDSFYQSVEQRKA